MKNWMLTLQRSLHGREATYLFDFKLNRIGKKDGAEPEITVLPFVFVLTSDETQNSFHIMEQGFEL